MRKYNGVHYRRHKASHFAAQSIRRAAVYGCESDPKPVIAAIYRRAMTEPVIECFYCEKPIPLETRKRHIDHKTPLSRGGPNTAANIVICCVKCNQCKGPLTVKEYREKLERIAKAKR